MSELRDFVWSESTARSSVRSVLRPRCVDESTRLAGKSRMGIFVWGEVGCRVAVERERWRFCVLEEGEGRLDVEVGDIVAEVKVQPDSTVTVIF